MSVDATFTNALKAVLREKLLAGHTLKLNGIGTWKLVHRTQRQVHRDNGQVVMMPPKDELKFIAEKSYKA